MTQTTYAHYPGCSAHATGKEFDASVKAVFEALGIELREFEDWNCCGASSAHSTSHNLAVALPARNLALAAQTGLDVVAPCAACYNRLRSAQQKIDEDPDRWAWLGETLGELPRNVVVRSPLSVIVHDVGLEKVAEHVSSPLTGLRVVSYYGCLLARPKSISELDDTEHPHVMDDLLRILGAEPLPWSYAVDCCGGALSLSRADIAARMTQRIVDAARQAGAQALVTACPLCQVNLEMRQSGEPLPTLYFTELMGLAFGLPETGSWWGKHLINPRPLLSQLELVG